MKCYEYYENNCNKRCQRKKCRYWVESDKSSNCAIVKANKGPSTLQEIGELFKITRMRVCQIEKTIINKIKKRAHDALSLNLE